MLGKPRRRPEYKSIRMKALATIEMLTCNVDFNEDELLSAIYKYSHVGLGHCLNKHEDWVSELDEVYKRLSKTS